MIRVELHTTAEGILEQSTSELLRDPAKDRRIAWSRTFEADWFTAERREDSSSATLPSIFQDNAVRIFAISAETQYGRSSA